MLVLHLHYGRIVSVELPMMSCTFEALDGDKCTFGQSKEDQEDWLLVEAGLSNEAGGYDHTTLSGDCMQLI